MSLLGSVKSIWSVVSGSPKTIDDVFDKDSGHLSKIGAWIGNANFTDEEQAELNAKIATGVQQFAVDTLTENTDRSKTRRELAVHIIKFYTLLIFMTGITYPISKEWSAVWFELCRTGGLVALVTGVGLFFWGTHHIRSMKSKG